MQGRKLATLIIASSAVIGLAVLGLQPMPQQVDTNIVDRGPLTIAIEEEGKTRIVDRYVISAPVAGYIRRVALDVGDTLKQNQALVTIESLPSELLDPRSRATALARIEAAKANFDAARERTAATQAETQLARIEYERMVALCRVQCASKEQEDLALTRLRSNEALEMSSQFAVDIARHELEAAQAALEFAQSKGTERLIVPSPIDGQVLKVLRESEGVVNRGEPLIEVGNPHHLEVEVDVLSADAVKISAGTRVIFERWGGDAPIEGRVRTIEPVGFTKVSALGVEEQRVLVIADLSTDPAQWQRLGDGYRVEAKFVLWHEDNLLRVPSSSLFKVNGDWAVFKVIDDRAVQTPVEIGKRNGLSAQVLSGLNEGEAVITHPSSAIEDGSLIETR